MIIAQRINYISTVQYSELEKTCTSLSIKIKKFINSKNT